MITLILKIIRFNRVHKMYERKLNVPHKKCNYVWQLQENYKYVTGNELSI